MTGLARRSHYGLRPDWRQLSSGVGVPPGPGITLPFPPSKVRATVSESLPPAAKQDSHILDFDEVFNRWETSSGAAHGPKTHRDVYAQPNYPLTSRIKKTLGVKDFGEKLQLRPCRHPLTMAYQESETKGKYKGWPNLGPETIRRAGPQPWELECYHAQGPSQASSKNQAFFGLPFRVPGQYYLTTTARDFRYYTRVPLRIQEFLAPSWTLAPPSPSPRGGGLAPPPLHIGERLSPST
ncbi:stabilizer of axonemal microtubules 3 [Petaurus breviceps papuanus]|uniref:stabilizer of axonemal microtubules 3 n=1 Tax=Petaurus breviceps papuanus TaxID=3040969 RepID=UPI0036DB2584